MVAIGILFSTLFHLFVKEKEPINFSSHEQRIINEAEEMVEKPHLTWKDWFFQPQFYMVTFKVFIAFVAKSAAIIFNSTCSVFEIFSFEKNPSILNA